MRKRFAARITWIFGAWACALAVLYGSLVMIMAVTAEDRLMANILTEEAEQIRQFEPHHVDIWVAEESGDAAVPPLPAFVLPQGIDPDRPGIQEVQTSDGRQVFALAIAPESKTDNRILFLDRAETQAVSRHIEAYTRFLAIVTLAGLLSAAGLSFWVGRRAAEPVVALWDLVRSGPLNALPARFADRFGDDEVGDLALALETSMEQAREALERERIFNAGLSHELRSTLHVAEQSLELIASRAEQAPAPQALDRLQRAIETMRSSADAFLWLTRKTSSVDILEEIDAAVIAGAVAARLEPVATSRGIALKVDHEGPVRISAPAAVLDVIIANLVRNALQHSGASQVNIRVSPGGIAVRDDGQGITADQRAAFARGERIANTRGSGLGLVLSRRLCERFGWSLMLDSQEIERGLTARVKFGD